MRGTETNYWRAIGSAQALIEKAAAIGQGWLKGIGSAQRLLRPQETLFDKKANLDESGYPSMGRERLLEIVRTFVKVRFFLVRREP
jgi:hypothetical protein